MVDHPITPPPDLIEQWHNAWIDAKVKHDSLVDFVATQAANWGADQELEACVQEVSYWSNRNLAERLRASRRFKLQSFKEQALVALRAIALGADDTREFYQDLETIKTALEQLDD